MVCVLQNTGQTNLSRTRERAQDDRLWKGCTRVYNGWLVELETEAHQGLEKVDQGHGNLVLKKDQLQADLKAVEVLIEESQGFYQKLREIVANCEEMKVLPPACKATVLMRKNLKQAIADMKLEVQKALVFADNRICAIPAEAIREECDAVFRYID